ncbi:MAG: hypothetical protein DME46_08880 [Verrucomicrobia bacterium]|nr:MAG: hypothetical protein DME46_08880 [Verrucomicrobiota bacterium]
MKRKTIVVGALLAGIASAIFAQTPSSSAQPSPSADTKTTVDSLAPAEIDETIRALKSNFVDPNALKDQEINRATLEGLLTRLHGGAIHIGYVRIGSLTNDNLRAMEKALTDFTSKKVDALVIDLRATGSNDFDIAAETTKRFVAKGKTLWSLRKTAAHQDRAFTNDRDPVFQGTIMVLIDGETSGPAEAMAAALKAHGQALLIGQPSAGRAVEYSDFPLLSGKILRIAVGEVVGPNGQSLFPGGVRPDLPVELLLAQKRQIFALSLQRGLTTFVFEGERPHFNEAALIAGTNPELDIRQQRRNPEENLHDAVLQRAVDVITSLAVFQKH